MILTFGNFFFDPRQGVILEEVGLGKVVESVREQVWRDLSC